jgi:hypothetical protein
MAKSHRLKGLLFAHVIAKFRGTRVSGLQELSDSITAYGYGYNGMLLPLCNSNHTQDHWSLVKKKNVGAMPTKTIEKYLE